MPPVPQNRAKTRRASRRRTIRSEINRDRRRPVVPGTVNARMSTASWRAMKGPRPLAMDGERFRAGRLRGGRVRGRAGHDLHRRVLRHGQGRRRCNHSRRRVLHRRTTSRRGHASRSADRRRHVALGSARTARKSSRGRYRRYNEKPPHTAFLRDIEGKCWRELWGTDNSTPRTSFGKATVMCFLTGARKRQRPRRKDATFYVTSRGRISSRRLGGAFCLADDCPAIAPRLKPPPRPAVMHSRQPLSPERRRSFSWSPPR